MGRPRTSLLDRERIGAAATELIREHGEFSLPMLARRLKVQPASLYYHVAGREEIVELVRERVVAGIDTDVLLDREWQDALAAWARSYRDAFASHASTIGTLTTQTVRDPSSVAMYERAIDCLLSAGFPERDLMAVITALENFIMGSALDKAAPDVMVEGTPELPGLQAALALTPQDSRRAEEAFTLGLDAMIAGLEHRLRSTRTS